MSYDDGPSARRILGLSMLSFAGLIVFLLVVAGVVVGAWQAGWWFQTKDIQRQSNVIRLNYATQESYLSELSQYIGTIDGIESEEAQTSGTQLADLQAQALSTGNQACALVPQLSISLGADQSWVSANCQAGAVSPGSPLRKG
jgi:hypothetical protein